MDEPRTRIDFDAAAGDHVDVDVEAAARAFALLGEPVRLRILLALAGTRRADWDHDGLAYTDLRRAVDVEDGGRFNYHLDRLDGVFVRKEGDRYRLTYAGSRIVNVVFAGFIGRHVVHERAPIEGQAAVGEATVEAGFDDGRFAIWWAGEDDPLVEMRLPPTVAVERSLDELVELSSTVARTYTELAVEGMCPECWGELELTVAGADEPVRFSCGRCWRKFSLPAWYCVVYHPAITAWLARHDNDVTDLLSLVELAGRGCVTELDDDPTGVTVTFTVSGESLTGRLASDGSVTIESA